MLRRTSPTDEQAEQIILGVLGRLYFNGKYYRVTAISTATARDQNSSFRISPDRVRALVTSLHKKGLIEQVEVSDYYGNSISIGYRIVNKE